MVFFSAAILLSGCEKGTENINESESGLGMEQISFTVVNPISADVITKVDDVTTSTVEANGFRAAATKVVGSAVTDVWHNVLFSKSGTQYVGGKYWPIVNPGYSFYATNSDVTMTMGSSGAVLSGITADKDVICAYLPSASVTYKVSNALSFEHIFARVTSVTVAAVTGYTISDVTISLVPKTTGTYTIAAGAEHSDGTGWSSTSGSATVNVYRNAGSPGIGDQSNNVYLIPGSYNLTASWTATRGEYVQSFSKTVSVNIVGGKRNTISTTLGGNATELVFTVNVAEWGDNALNPSFPAS